MKTEVNEYEDNLSVSGQTINSYENHPVPYENIKQLDEKGLAFEEDDRDALTFIMESIAKGTSDFQVKRMVGYGSDKVVGVLYYSKNESGLFELDRIKATLYHSIKIDPIVINGIDIKRLESEMMTMDWGFEKFRWGREIEDALRLISQDEDGKRIAVALWNNAVPSVKYEKPDFIEAIENDLGTYITRGFSGDVMMKQVYRELKERQLIDEQLLKLPIDVVHNHQARLVMTEQLFKGEPFSSQLPTSVSEWTELFFTWDKPSKQINFYDEDGIAYCGGKMGDFEKVIVNANLKNEPLLTKHRDGNRNGLGL